MTIDPCRTDHDIAAHGWLSSCTNYRMSNHELSGGSRRRMAGRSSHAAALLRAGIVLALALLMTACGEEAARTPDSDERTARKPSPEAPSRGGAPRDSAKEPSPAEGNGGSRPKSRIDTIMVEGAPQPIRLRLLDEGLPFTTYFPEDEFTAESASSDEGIGIRFVARFGGTLNPDAYLTLFLPSARTTVPAMEKFVTQYVIKSHGWKSRRAGAGEYYAWSRSSFAISGKSQESGTPITGHLCIGTHADNAFYMMAVYPPEYGDGFGPREALIISELRWRDDGEGMSEER